MEKRSWSEMVADSAGNRAMATDLLVQGIELTEGERAFLALAVQLKDTWSESTSTLYSAKVLEAALDKHALALIRASEATDRYNRSLTIATWFMAFTTLALFAVAIVGLIK